MIRLMRVRSACTGALILATVVPVQTISAQTSVPTFSKDVAPILYQNCASCHRPGDIAPMSLLTYEQVRPWAKSIREKVAQGVMPPWHSDAPRGTFSNDRRLTDHDKDILLSWASGGAPQGDPKDLPAMPKFTEGWEIGTPDVVLSMEKPYEVPAKGTIPYQYITIPTNFTEDKWVQAIEVRPGARSVVHHVLVFSKEAASKDSGAAPRPVPAFTSVVPPPAAPPPAASQPAAARSTEGGAARPAQFQNPGTLIATTAPGTNAMTFRPGEAILIKAGSELTFQVHYTANGTATNDLSSVGFIFAKEKPIREIHTSAFVNAAFTLPAGAADKAVDSAIQFNQDVHITALFPHTHLRGKNWVYRLVYPDGRSEVVLPVPKYDFNWQTYYVFTTPLAVPRGSRLEATAHYDNSANNKWNPDPTIDVHWGEQTWQEMQYTGITYFVDDAGKPAPTESARN